MAARERELAEEEQRKEEAAFIASRTRMQQAQATRNVSTGVNVNAVLTNSLFANAGSARRIGFAIDISGSMSSSTDSGQTRIAVVKRHLASSLRSMAGAPGAAFGISCFDSSVTLPLGPKLLSATRPLVAKGLTAVAGITARGSNGCDIIV